METELESNDPNSQPGSWWTRRWGEGSKSINRPIKQVATVAVIDGHKLLMGKRRDNQKWTMPGGHLDPGESPYRGAIRELYEESGIKGVIPVSLGSEDVVCEDGQTRRIHCFAVQGNYRTNVAADPDKEVRNWEWIEIKDGLPRVINEHLHSPRNVLLKKLGLQKW